MNRIKEIELELDRLNSIIDTKRENFDWSKSTSFKDFENVGKEEQRRHSILLAEKKRLVKPEILNRKPSGTLMTFKAFKENVKLGGFIDYDGYGYYHDGENCYNISIYPSEIKNNINRKDFSHVMWINR